jgi:inner membrane protein
VLVVPVKPEAAEATGTRVAELPAPPDLALFLPDSLGITGTLKAEERRRGIFRVPVYSADLRFSGRFQRPDPAPLGLHPDRLDWGRARLVVGLPDPRAIRRAADLEWNTERLAFLPGAGGLPGDGAGIQVPLDLSEALPSTPFSFGLSFNGSGELFMVPAGRITSVELASEGGQPAFEGNWLPVIHSITDAGFEARWEVPYLGRNFPQSWRAGEGSGPERAVGDTRFGFRLVQPLDGYRMAERSVKYASLFLGLTFAGLWLFEIRAGRRIHPIQYLLLGAALCLFFLLELSLSEHIGFGAAYALASLAIASLVGVYGRSLLGSALRALLLALGTGFLYGYLYLLLGTGELALLLGSVGLFLALAVVMFATRRVDWYAVHPLAAERDVSRQDPAGR